MARPKLGTAPYVNVGMRLDPQVLPALDAYVEALRREMWEVRIDRGVALRRLVVSGLRSLGYLASDSGGGPVQAPRPDQATAGDAPTPDVTTRPRARKKATTKGSRWLERT